MKIVVLTDKSWHDRLFSELQTEVEADWIRVKEKESFTFEFCESVSPDWIFIPHWSHIIPEKIYKNFKCVVFHMTDLPYGRGGSPLQNLIVRGHKETKISAIQVDKEIDSGDIYLKRSLGLQGTAEEIFVRSSKIIKEMIATIINENPVPQKQVGEVVKFARRRPEDGNISELKTIEEVYDYIRMLDCKGYPNAFLETENLRLEFSKGSIKSDKTIKADVRITEK